MNETTLIVNENVAIIPVQADTDARLIALWLHGRPRSTQRAYRGDVAAFLAAVAAPLRSVTLGHMQAYVDTLAHLAPATRARRINAVKSLFSFARELGYIPMDVARAVKSPPIRNAIAERIMGEADVHRLLALEPNARNRAMLRLMYASGMRVSELCSLRWRDLTPREEGGQIAIFGKGGKTRHVLLPRSVWDELLALRGEAGANDAVFRSRKGGTALTSGQVWQIVKDAARRAGLGEAISPHWMRHAHASHALDRGAPIHLVQQTLGHANVATTSRYTHARPGESSGRYLAL